MTRATSAAAAPESGRAAAWGAQAQARLLWWGALAVGAVLRFWELTASSLWSDEGNTWAIVQRSFTQIARDAAADIHPPLYYWLLKVWSAPWGYSAFALRSFSAVCGVALIALVWQGARSCFGARRATVWLAPLAAWIAALNPFQIYYSQEARMYMLLAVEAAALLVLLLSLLEREDSGERVAPVLAAYALVAAAGLWTHYSFGIVPVALGAGYLVVWLRRAPRWWGRLGAFAAANLAALLVFAPWLPIALRQVSTWPQGSDRVPALEGLRLTLHTLLFGLIRPVPQPEWPWLAAAAILPLLGFFALRRARSVWPVALLLAAPVALMAALGLFTEAFLKFLLVASAPWCILVAAAPETGGERPRVAAALRGALVLGAALLALLTLPGYYTNTAARDNYQGIAQALALDPDPGAALVILDAPGQADVWRYYDPGIPWLAVPAARPFDPAQLEVELEGALAGKQRVYALLWATDEADPDGIVESYLDAHLYKGLESWQGNVRFAAYSAAGEMECRPTGAPLWEPLSLAEICRPPGVQPQEVRQGEPAVVSLVWQATQPPERDLHVSVQLLDARGQVVAQHDGAPGGGLRPTLTWRAGERVSDNHALFIPPGTPPGPYRAVAVVYDPATGERLAGPDGDTLALGDIRVLPGGESPLSRLQPMQHPGGDDFGAVRLVGYDMHKKGFGHAPETPLVASDLLHLTLYWSLAEAAPPADMTFTLALGDEALTAPLAGGGYPTSQWEVGRLVRGEFDIRFDGAARRPMLTVGEQSVRLAAIP